MSRLAHNRFPLPLVVNPPQRVCVSLEIPDDPNHWAAFFGALHELEQGMAWADDPAHTAKAVIQVWRDVILNMQYCVVTPTGGPVHGAEIEDFMPLRVDCDCNVWVTCCDGTEKQILTSDQVQAAINGPAVPGAPQPEAGGGCVTYDLTNFGNAPALIPTPVSTGDTIELISADGATSIDGLAWLCADDGKVFFGGLCVGTPATSGGDRLPAEVQGKCIILLDGSFYAFAGTSFVVPAGITNKQPSIWLNWPAGDPIYGSVNAKVKICNHGTVSWESVFDFTVSNYGLNDAGSSTHPVYTPGLGWTLDTSGSEIAFVPTFTAVLLTHVDLDVVGSSGFTSPSSNFVRLGPAYGADIVPFCPGPGAHNVSWNSSGGTSHNDINPTVGGGGGSGTVLISKMTVRGLGTKPAGFP